MTRRKFILIGNVIIRVYDVLNITRTDFRTIKIGYTNNENSTLIYRTEEDADKVFNLLTALFVGDGKK